jgi:hypothetical protein
MVGGKVQACTRQFSSPVGRAQDQTVCKMAHCTFFVQHRHVFMDVFVVGDVEWGSWTVAGWNAATEMLRLGLLCSVCIFVLQCLQSNKLTLLFPWASFVFSVFIAPFVLTSLIFLVNQPTGVSRCSHLENIPDLKAAESVRFLCVWQVLIMLPLNLKKVDKHPWEEVIRIAGNTAPAQGPPGSPATEEGFTSTCASTVANSVCCARCTLALLSMLVHWWWVVLHDCNVCYIHPPATPNYLQTTLVQAHTTACHDNRAPWHLCAMTPVRHDTCAPWQLCAMTAVHHVGTSTHNRVPWHLCAMTPVRHDNTQHAAVVQYPKRKRNTHQGTSLSLATRMHRKEQGETLMDQEDGPGRWQTCWYV